MPVEAGVSRILLESRFESRWLCRLLKLLRMLRFLSPECWRDTCLGSFLAMLGSRLLVREKNEKSELLRFEEERDERKSSALRSEERLYPVRDDRRGRGWGEDAYSHTQVL